MKLTLPGSYFDFVYNNSQDPWNYETSDYEKEKYKTTIKSLPKERYKNALEIGCSIGVLTKCLAAKCESLLSIDINDKALQKAEQRLKDFSNVKFEKMQFPKEYPATKFDLVVMSEVGYYLSLEDLRVARKKIINILQQNGHLVLVHWLPFVEDYPLTGDEVHNLFTEPNAMLQKVLGFRKEKYRLDVYKKVND